MGVFEGLYRLVMRRNAVYVTFVVTGALVGERVRTLRQFIHFTYFLSHSFFTHTHTHSDALDLCLDLDHLTILDLFFMMMIESNCPKMIVTFIYLLLYYIFTRTTIQLYSYYFAPKLSQNDRQSYSYTISYLVRR